MAALGAAVVAALAAIVNGAMVVFDAAGVVVAALAEETGQTAAQVEAQLGGPETIKALVESDTVAPLYTRAYAVLICGALLLIFGLLMRKAATWARILVTIFAVATGGFSLIIATIPEDGTNLMILLSWIGVIVSVIALVLTWLPANGRYAKAAR